MGDGGADRSRLPAFARFGAAGEADDEGENDNEPKLSMAAGWGSGEVGADVRDAQGHAAQDEEGRQDEN
jgi:hypothetical protein